jgi:allantoinase
MRVDLIIKNGKIVTSTGIYNAGLAIDNGKIVSIAMTPHLPPSDEVIDAKGNFVMPGVIDAHVHFWDPGYTYREDWATGTMSAAGGGVTTVIEMPTTSPPTITPEAFKAKKEIAKRKAFVDFALHAGVTPATIQHIDDLSKEGAASFKMFMAEKVREFDRMDKGSLYESLTRISAANNVASIHAESELVTYLQRKLQEAGRADPAAHLDSRPDVAEIDAISSAILLARETRARLHICHLSTARGVELIREGKEKGVKVSAETCPQYLLFNKQDYIKLGPYLKVNPPVRTSEDQLALWDALRNCIIEIIASDHCPFLREEKEVGWQNIWEAGTGIPGTETLLPLMLSEGVNKGRISMVTLCKLLCENPAKIFGLYPRKGHIAVGADADIIIVDLKQRRKITIEKMHTKGEFTPFDGWVIQGFPILVLVRGKIIAKDGEIVGKSGYGTFVPCHINKLSKSFKVNKEMK